MKQLCLILLTFIPILTFTQPTGMGGGMPSGGAQMAAMKIGKIYGTLVTEKGEPIPYATVQLKRSKITPEMLTQMMGGRQVPPQMMQAIEQMNQDSSLVAGQITDDKGAFMLDQLPMGFFKLKASYLGFEPFVKDSLTIFMGRADVNLGKLTMKETVVESNGVTVEATADLVMIAADRRIYNVGKDVASTGGSALDVMKNIPSVEVDMENNVSLRGSSNLQVMVDGKPITMPISAFLEQTPANLIDRIEVITNPSAKFDENSAGGIINIVMKRPKEAGFNGVLNTGVGDGITLANSFSTTNALSLNYKTPKYNLSFTGSINQFTFGFSGNSEREIYTSNPRILYSVTEDTSTGYRKMGANFGRLSFEYFLSPQSTFSIYGNLSQRGGNGDNSTINYTRNSNHDLVQQFTDLQDQKIKRLSPEFGGDYKRTFAGQGHEWISLISYAIEKPDDDNINTKQAQDLNGNNVGTPLPIREQTIGNNPFLTLQTDYTRPVGMNKLETGYKFTDRTVDQELIAQNSVNGAWINNASLSDQFIFDEQVHAAYFNFNGVKNQKWTYALGFRATHTAQSGKVANSTTSEKLDYFGYFPSASLKYAVSPQNTIGTSFTRRQNRPQFMVQNPFLDKSSSLNWRQGNFYLTPEFTNKLELTHDTYNAKGSLTTSIYYNLKENVVQWITNPIDNPDTAVADTVYLTTFENSGTDKSYGVEFITTYRPMSKLNLTTTFGAYRKEAEATIKDSLSTNAGNAWSIRLNANYTGKYFNSQLSTNYQSPTPIATGKLSGMAGTDIGFSKSLLANSLTISARIQDVFNQRRFKVTATDKDFNYNLDRKFGGRTYFVSLSWLFGKSQSFNMKQRKRNNDDGSTDGGMQF